MLPRTWTMSHKVQVSFPKKALHRGSRPLFHLSCFSFKEFLGTVSYFLSYYPSIRNMTINQNRRTTLLGITPFYMKCKYGRVSTRKGICFHFLYNLYPGIDFLKPFFLSVADWQIQRHLVTALTQRTDPTEREAFGGSNCAVG